MHLDIITELLELQNYKAAMVIKTEESINVILERIKDTPPVCSGCGKVHGTSTHSSDVVTVEDLRIFNKRVSLTVPKRKVRCVEDNTIRVEEIPWLRGRVTDRFAEQVYRLTSITTNQEAGWFLGPSRAALAGRRVAIVSGPTRAISMTLFLAELGLAPSLIVVDFDSDTLKRLQDLAGPECEILIEPEQEEIRERLKACRIDLVFGGMLEKSLAASLGIEHLDMMHGSQRTLGFAGAEHLITALGKQKPRRPGG